MFILLWVIGPRESRKMLRPNVKDDLVKSGRGATPHHRRVDKKRGERRLLLDALRRRLCDDAVLGDFAIDENK